MTGFNSAFVNGELTATWYCYATSDYDNDPRTTYTFDVKIEFFAMSWRISKTAVPGSGGSLDSVTPTWPSDSFSITEYTLMDIDRETVLPSVQE